MPEDRFLKQALNTKNGTGVSFSDMIMDITEKVQKGERLTDKDKEGFGNAVNSGAVLTNTEDYIKKIQERKDNDAQKIEAIKQEILKTIRNS